jgi:hypothetical protein
MRIITQHDNALSHFQEFEPSWMELVANKYNWRFYLKQQPPNSPDTNVLDFTSIQSMKWGLERETTIDRIATIQSAWDQYNPKVLDQTGCPTGAA